MEQSDVIKIDIEGSEYKILPELIKNKNKIKKVLCEMHGNPDGKKLMVNIKINILPKNIIILF